MGSMRQKTLQTMAIVMLSLLLGGCSSIRDWWVGARPTYVQAPQPGPERGAWVPLLPGRAPLRPAPYNGAGGQLEGLVAVVQEVDALMRLVDLVAQMPAQPGEVSVNFRRIQADLSAVRAGLLEAVLQPRTAPRDLPV